MVVCLGVSRKHQHGSYVVGPANARTALRIGQIASAIIIVYVGLEIDEEI